MRKLHVERVTRSFPFSWVLCTLMLMCAGNVTLAAYASSPIAIGGKAVVANTGGDPIRLRQNAGTSFPKVGAAHEGEVVIVLDGPRSDGKGGRWFKLQAPGGTGWMLSDFLTSAVATQSAQPKPDIGGPALVSNTGGDPLRMRSAPGTTAAVLTLLDAGSTVVVKAGPFTDEGGTVWYEVAAKGLVGWSMAQYLAPTSPPAAQNAAPQAVPAVAKVAAPAASATAATRSTPAPTAPPKPTPVRTSTPKPAAPTAILPAVASGKSSQTQYRQWVEDARQMYPYPQSSDKMWRVMLCESGGNPGASGGGGRYLGLFQYLPSTWAGNWNPYRTSSIWDAHAQIFATAKAWSIGMQGQWSCFYMN